MSLSRICGLCTLGALLFSIALGVGWETRDYELQHKPMAQAMWAWIEYDKCRDATEEAQLKVCKSLQIPPERCPIDLSQCDKYKEKE